MKNRMLGLILFLMLLGSALMLTPSFFPLVYAPATGEQFKNGGIEYGNMTGWEAGANGGSATNAYAHSGTYSFILSGVADAEEQRFDSPYMEKEDFSVFSFWCRMDLVGGGATFQVIFNNGSDYYTGFYGVGITLNTWIKTNVYASGAWSEISAGSDIIGLKITNTNFNQHYDDFTASPPIALIVRSYPEIQAIFSIDGINHTTVYTNDTVDFGSYDFNVTEREPDRGRGLYNFTYWRVSNITGSFNYTNPEITLSLTVDTILTIFFQAPEYVFNIRYIFGLIGLAMIIVAPTYGIWEIRKNKNYMAIITAFVLAAIGYAFVVVWLTP